MFLSIIVKIIFGIWMTFILNVFKQKNIIYEVKHGISKTNLDC